MLRLRDPFVLIGIGAAGVLFAFVLLSSLEWPGRTFSGFLVLENKVVASAGLASWPATRAGIYQAEVASLDGQPVGSASELRMQVAALEPGIPLRYEFERDGAAFEREVLTRGFSSLDWVLLFGSLLFCGVGLCGMALAIRFLRGSDPTALGSSLFLWIGGIWALSAVDLYGPAHWFRVHAFHECLLFAGAIHMALVFPQPSRWFLERQWIAAIPYGLALLLAGANQWWLFDAGAYRITHGAAMGAFALSLIGLIGSQAWSWFRPASFEAKQRMKVVILGTLVALAPQVILLLSGAASGKPASENAMAFSGVFYPLSIGYAVLRGDLLEVDSFVQRSLNYLLVTLAVALGYMGLLAGASFALGPEAVGGPVFILASALMATAFLPLRHKIQDIVDRVFFRSHFDFRQLVSEASGRLASVTDLEQIRQIVESAVRDALQPSSLRLEIRPEGEAWYQNEQSAGPIDWGDGRLLVPFSVEDRLVAQLWLGRRLSGGGYDGEDRRLLRTLANYGAVALDHALGLERLRDLNQDLELRVAERTGELEEALYELREAQQHLVHREKMASVGQLVAGVAHEINNPLNFIEGNLHHLREYGVTLGVAVGELEAMVRTGADEAKLAELRERLELDFVMQDLGSVFEGCQEGVERATTIVRDLRTFSRADRGVASEIDLNAFLDTTAHLLKGRLDDVELHREYDSALPPVECLEGQLSQVFMNLVANAADAAGEGGRVMLRTARLGADRVLVEVSDSGPGIAPEHLSRIFEPFFTTKDVGAGTGLGLAISFGVIARHGGTLQASNSPRGGACFRVEIPTAYSPVAEPETSQDGPEPTR